MSASQTIDKEDVRRRLLERERELSGEIARFNEDARDSSPSDVEDPIDAVTATEAKAGSFAASNIAAETLENVRSALDRLDSGEYGKCVDCGRTIEPARLKAVPEAAYCLEDQEKHDQERAQQRTTDGDLS